MLYIHNNNLTDPRVNLALEEYVLRNFDIEEEYLLLYVNSPSVVIGKHQNVLEEVDPDFLRERGVPVLRRVSGGGAVYHDLGNLNFSFITRYDKAKYNRYDIFLAPVIAALQRMGVDARQGPRNEILVGDVKISGNAQFTSRDRMLSHGTLLVNAELDALQRALRPAIRPVQSKGVQSVRSRVANIAEFLPGAITMEEFRKALLAHIHGKERRERVVTSNEWEAIHQLAQTKYDTWEWNYGRSPQFTIHKRIVLSGGVMEATLGIKDGVIERLLIEGEHPGLDMVDSWAKLLHGVPYDRTMIENVLNTNNPIEGVPIEEQQRIVELFY